MSLSSNIKIKDCLLEVTNIKISLKPFIVSLEFVEDHCIQVFSVAGKNQIFSPYAIKTSLIYCLKAVQNQDQHAPPSTAI